MFEFLSKHACSAGIDIHLLSRVYRASAEWKCLHTIRVFCEIVVQVDRKELLRRECRTHSHVEFVADFGRTPFFNGKVFIFFNYSATSLDRIF
jgi:hypothetical protein